MTRSIAIWLFAVTLCFCKHNASMCKWNQKPDDPHVYWVNMDKSADRKISMTKHLDEVVGPNNHHRVRGLTLQEILIPNDIEKTWNSYGALYETRNRPPPTFFASSSYKLIVSGLFGRKKANRLKELGCTISHLTAMRQAIYDTSSNSKYAIITEDDVQYPFAVDWEGLVESAPKDFGILMLFNSNKETLSEKWGEYVNPRKKTLWIEKWPGQPSGYWSTCAYLINKAVLKPILNGILTVRDGIDDVKIFGGVRSPCVPKNSTCCVNGTQGHGGYIYTGVSPCIWSPKGFQADAYLYAMVKKTYVLTVPVIVNGAGGNESTFHQDHVESIHEGSFKRMREISNMMLSGNVAAPKFMTAACPGKLLQTVSMKVAKTTDYKFNLPKDKIEIFYVNVDTNVTERAATVNHLNRMGGAKVTVIDALTVDEIFIPKELQSGWSSCPAPLPVDTISYQQLIASAAEQRVKLATGDLKQLPIKSDWFPRGKMQRTAATSATATAAPSSSSSSTSLPYKVALSSLCGRTEDLNAMFHLSLTLTHLLAIRQAVHSTTATSKYALIVEDDVWFHLDFSLPALVDSAPKDFGILQLSNANSRVERFFIKYIREKRLWPNIVGKFDHPLSTAAYIINRDVLRPVIDKIISQRTIGSWSGFDVKLIAGRTRPCEPSSCCSLLGGFETKAPCFLSIPGFRPDSFLQQLAPYYVLTLPVAVIGGQNSLSAYRQAFMRAEGLSGLGQELKLQRKVVNELFGGSHRLPDFIVPACNRGLEEVPALS